MVKKLEILQLGFGVRGTMDKNLSQKEQDKGAFANKLGKCIGVNTYKLKLYSSGQPNRGDDGKKEEAKHRQKVGNIRIGLNLWLYIPPD